MHRMSGSESKGSRPTSSVGDAAISRNTFQPGAHCALGGKRVSGNQRANQSCQAHHTGVLTEGQLHIEMDDGSTLDLGPNDVFDIPPGHDGWAIGDVPMRGINWSGVRTWIPEPEAGERVLASVLFSDIVGSTELASRVGDDGWRELLGRHNREVEISSIDSAVGRSIRRATVFSPSSTVPRASTPPRRSATGCGPLGSRSDRASTLARSSSSPMTCEGSSSTRRPGSRQLHLTVKFSCRPRPGAGRRRRCSVPGSRQPSAQGTGRRTTAVRDRGVNGTTASAHRWARIKTAVPKDGRSNDPPVGPGGRVVSNASAGRRR